MTSPLKMEGLKKPFGNAIAMQDARCMFQAAGHAAHANRELPTTVAAVGGLGRRRDQLDKARSHQTNAAAWTISDSRRFASASRSVFKHPKAAPAGREEEGK